MFFDRRKKIQFSVNIICSYEKFFSFEKLTIFGYIPYFTEHD